VWFKSEDYLRRLARDKGLHYFPIHRDELPGRMIERKGQYFVSEGKDLYPVDFLYGREFGTIFRQGLLRLVSTTLDGRIWMETPLNHIYRQKWGLALPFMARFRDLFDDRLRQVLIPAALIQGRRVDLSPIVPYLESPERQRLLAVRTIEDLAELPTSLRRALVFKCGAGRGGLHSHGKGVLRIGGSRGAARKILDFITERVESYNEPWIVQQYVDETHRIQVSLPEVVEEIQTLNAHARFMIFGRRSGGSPPTLMGGLGNYGKHWKVSGRSPDVDEHGNLMGTAFNDIRVVRPS
ncbi:MAG: hypothetical protein FJY85_09905, partial [Deltaproteobacteria bacterium]|nr:hypothetical protein [Deltaproteobacteria bacterium]